MTRTCTRCPHTLAEHAPGEDGFTKPCLQPGCSCTTFNDEQDEAAARAIVGEKQRAPLGFVH